MDTQPSEGDDVKTVILHRADDGKLVDAHESPGYAVPTYQAPADADWYHFLHGNVPGHQIDFIFRPDVPQGALARQHFSHLARLVKYIEPRLGNAYAFAIGNLSRDDTQYEPGHGGIALIFGLRIKGAFDHAGRQDPPFCHAVACVDRQIDAAAMFEASVRFHEQLLLQPQARTDGTRWYQSYVAMAQQASWSAPAEMQAYVRGFDRLPVLRPSKLGLRWTVEGLEPPRRAVIVYPDQTQFAVLAEHMARIASVLAESDIRWTAISTGREQDLLGGTTVRFVPEREAVQEPDDVVLLHIDQVPMEPRDIATRLFGAHEVRLSQTPEIRLKWRHLGEAPQPVAAPDSSVSRPWAKVPELVDKLAEVEPAAESSAGLSRPHSEVETTRKKRGGLLPVVVVGMVVVVLGLVGVGVMASQEIKRPVPAQQAPGGVGVGVSETVKTAARVDSVAPSQTVTPSATVSASASGKRTSVAPMKTGKKAKGGVGAPLGKGR